MKFSKYFRNCLINAAVLLTALSSCNAVTDDPTGPCRGDNTFLLSFKMITDGPLQDTRTDGMGHDEVESEFRSFEDGINRSDIALFIFAEAPEGTDGADETLIMKVTDIGSSTNPQMMITGSPGAYTITMSIKKDEFSKKLNYELDPNGTRMIRFRVLIIANSNLWLNQFSGHQITGTTYETVISQANQWQFGMSGIYSHNQGDSEVMGLYKGNIPMFGTNLFQVSEVDLWSSKAEERFYLGEVDLLRSLAKVRVVDNIMNKDASGYPQIREVEFFGSQSVVRPLPFDAVNYQNGYQVHTPNIYEPDKTLTLTGAPMYKLGTIPDAWDLTPASERKGVTRIGYVPEQKIGNIDGNIDKGMPIFRITVAMKKNADGSEETKDYDVPMTGYNTNGGAGGINFNFGSNILRNHIYTLSVNKVAVGTPTDITLSVEKWGTHDMTLDFTETLSVEPRLQWSDNTFQKIDGQFVILNPWTINVEGESVPVPLEGTFAIRTPQGATWTAYLLDTGGPDTNAFAFYDRDESGNFIIDETTGNPKMFDSVSGTVEGEATAKLSKLAIVARNPKPSGTEANRAVLQVVVTIGEGASASVMEAILVPEGSPFINFTIVQNPE